MNSFSSVTQTVIAEHIFGMPPTMKLCSLAAIALTRPSFVIASAENGIPPTSRIIFFATVIPVVLRLPGGPTRTT